MSMLVARMDMVAAVLVNNSKKKERDTQWISQVYFIPFYNMIRYFIEINQNREGY